MNITRLKLKNFKSYGENITEIDLPPNQGSLILLTGLNGSGKSSILEAIDYNLFNKVGNKLSNLTNHINGSGLWVELTFNINQDELIVARKLSKPRLTVTLNGEELETGSQLEKWLKNYLPFDVQTFKSFVSLSINDFKNLLVLSPEDKRNLIDKLFNLQLINRYRETNRQLQRENKKAVTSLEAKIETTEVNIQQVEASLQEQQNRVVDEIQAKMNELKNQAQPIKTEITRLQQAIEDANKELKQIEQNLEQLKEPEYKLTNEKQDLVYKFKECKHQLGLYDEGKCPTCGTDLLTGDWQTEKEKLELEQQNIKNKSQALKEQLAHNEEEQEKLNTQRREVILSQKKLERELHERELEKQKLKTQYQQLKEQLNTEYNSEETKKLLASWQKEIAELNRQLDELVQTNLAHQQLDDLFSEKGVKKILVDSLIEPLNEALSYYSHSLGVPYQLELTNSFDIVGEYLGQDIDLRDFLSSGENKRSVLAVLLSYLELIQHQNPINILFLDEVFATIDLEGVQDVIYILREFAHRFQVHIFVVHHAPLDQTNFDRVIKVEKDIFSYLEDSYHQN